VTLRPARLGCEAQRDTDDERNGDWTRMTYETALVGSVLIPGLSVLI